MQRFHNVTQTMFASITIIEKVLSDTLIILRMRFGKTIKNFNMQAPIPLPITPGSK